MDQIRNTDEINLRDEIKRLKQKIQFLKSSLDTRELSQYLNIINASPVPFALNDAKQKITYLNRAFTDTFGYNLNDIPTLEDWWPKAYPDKDYRNLIAETWTERLEKSKSTGNSFEPLELNISCKNKEIKTVIASASLIHETFLGNHLVVLYDITELKRYQAQLLEKERELVEIFDNLPSMIFLKEAKELRYVRFNSAGEKLTGIKREHIIGKNDYDFFPKDQADFFRDRDLAVLSSGKPEDIPEEPIDTPQGTRTLYTRKTAIHDSEGKPKYLLGISEDITERKKIQYERERLEKELQQLHKMESLGQLTGGIAHEFNNLLSIISGYTELGLEYSRSKSDDTIIEYLENIHAAKERAIDLVSQMLIFSRNKIPDLQYLNIEESIRENIKMLRVMLPSSIEICEEIESGLPAVLINETQLNQILMNLASNARDAMNSEGKITIRLKYAKNLNLVSTITHQEIQGDWVELSVQDIGIGMTEDLIKDIFTPYFTTKPVGKGTGMGLSLLYGIVRNSGGEILVESSPGKGSTFRLFFPPVEKKINENTDFRDKKSDIIYGNGECILVVDDEKSLANYLGKILKNTGYNTVVLSDSLSALEYYSANPDKYKVIITDQTMPNQTGLELIKNIRKINPHQPVCLCSGYSDKIYIEQLGNENIIFLQKPVSRQTLLETLQKLL